MEHRLFHTLSTVTANEQWWILMCGGLCLQSHVEACCSMLIPFYFYHMSFYNHISKYW